MMLKTIDELENLYPTCFMQQLATSGKILMVKSHYSTGKLFKSFCLSCHHYINFPWGQNSVTCRLDLMLIFYAFFSKFLAHTYMCTRMENIVFIDIEISSLLLQNVVY